MGILSGCRTSVGLLKILFKNARGVTSLAHSKRPVTKEKLDVKKNTGDIKIDKKTIAKLERISLVDFDNEGGIQRLEAAIRFAQKLREVRLDPSVRPMYSVLENEKLELREDRVTEGNCREEILKNAKVLEDEYFVAPPGNIPKNS
ncbi:glutamyl-tRNA(Gln) amidotransferase subunit C, mitochondrial [Copidosoma floridanum]|uniref:glutamyl-tRNA(Gln) amidotransferase subunit C, mitochondrial n=1 Tax=Copidosoma floridanum TaxID=29053 RepID=UPI0006C9A37D|nr:glutamyl-tRNA(Gln) amidotransferase subunit C, mitochondrial [Copidosoma floridanum]